MLSAPPDPMTATDQLAARAHAPAPATLATLAEVFGAQSSDGTPSAFVLSQLPREDGPVLWVQDRLSRREAGVLSMAGLPAGMQLILVEVNRPVDVLWAMEQGLACGALAAVVGEVYGDPPVLDFTASKRLALRSEAHRVPGWLIRRGAEASLSAARCRWRVSARPSPPHAYDPQAPGPATWTAELFRNRHGRTGEWLMSLPNIGDAPNVQGLFDKPEDALPLARVA